MTDSDFRGYLLPEERILWQGAPDVRAYALRGWWYLLPLSLGWGGFAIAWEIGVITSKAPLLFSLWGIPFVLLGLYLIFGRLIVARREAQNTMYAITDRRVLLVSGAFRRTFRAIELSQLPEAQLDEGAHGLGSITFGSAGFIRLPPGWPTMGSYRQAAAFQAIPGAKNVFDILQRARYELTSAATRG